MSTRSLVARLWPGARRTVSKDRRGRARLSIGFAIAAATVVAITLVALVLLPAHRSARTPARSPAPPIRAEPTKPLQADVTIAARAPAVGVPRSFLGLSTEYWALPIWERQMPILDRVLSLVHVPGDGPLVIRVGGDSSDEALWEPRMRKIPEWVIELTPAWLSETRALVHRSGIQLILDLNLVTASPAEAAEWARAAESGLPPGAIAGFEIGNEPDLYNRSYWMTITSGTGLGSVILPRALSPRDYAHDFRSYADVLRVAAPGTPLLGPAVAYPSHNLSWISTLLAGSHPGLREVTAHEYPSSACAVPGSSGYPTIPQLLSESAVTAMATSLRSAVRLAHRAGMSFRLTELNSATCGGCPGVNDAFATALWAPEALFELLRAGVDAVNVHVRPALINAAFSLTGRGLVARPLLYGLILFGRTLGDDPRLLRLRVHARGSLPLDVWAVRVRGALHVLLINTGRQPVTALLRLPPEADASVERLLAPSAASCSGVTLAGQQLDSQAFWEGRYAAETIAPGTSGYSVAVPPLSAALVSVHLRGGTSL